MASFMRTIAMLAVLGVIGTATAFNVSDQLVVAPSLPDPPAAPCKQQDWVNADRNCLKWTGTRERKIEVDHTVTGSTAQPALLPASVAETSTVPADEHHAAADRRTAPAQTHAALRLTPPATAQAAAPSPAAPPIAARPPAIGRVATVTPAKSSSHKHPAQRRGGEDAWRLVRSFGDNLSTLPVRAYAPDRQRRRTAGRANPTQDPFFYRSER